MRVPLPLSVLLVGCAVPAGVLSGCDTHSGTASRLELVVSRLQFAPGDEVLLVLDNDTGEDQTYAPCEPALYRAVDVRHFAPVDPDVTFCEDVAVRIRPGQSVPFRFQLDDGLAEGTYAIALQVGEPAGPSAGQYSSVLSGRFEVATAE
jgi:hypothetical protein